MQVQYSRFINVHGRQGCNIPCDLYMEHLNRTVKTCIVHLGANKTERSIQRVGKSISLINEMMEKFDHDNGIASASTYHPIPLSKTDRDHILDELNKQKVFSVIPGREHMCFKKFRCNIMKTLNKDKIKMWMDKQFKELIDIIAIKS